MKIAIDIRTIGKQRTGSETVIVELTKRLITTYYGDEFILLTDTIDTEAREYIRRVLDLAGKKNVRVQQVSPKRRTWFLGGAARALRRSGAEIFLTENIVPLGISRKTNVVTIIHDTSFKSARELIGKKDLFLLDCLIPRSLRRANAIVAVSAFTEKEIATHYPFARGKVYVIPNAVGTQFREEVTQEDRARVRKKHHLPAKYIFALGTMQPRKNIPFLITAFAQIADKIEDVHLVLSGKRGHHFDTAIDAAIGVRPQLRERITFTGYISYEDVPAVYAEAAVFVYPSLYEGFGIPLLEAMAVNTPVAASDIPPHREVAGKAAAYFSPRKIDECARVVYDVCTDEALRDDMLSHARQQRELFSWDQSASRIYDVFRELNNHAYSDNKDHMAEKDQKPPQPLQTATSRSASKTSTKRNILISVFVVVVVLVGFLIWRAESFTNTITTRGSLIGSIGKSLPGAENTLKGQTEGRINILLLGMRGKGLPGGGELTDTIIVASLLREGSGADALWRYALTSIPRDLLVTMPGGGKSKINAVYAGAETAGNGQGLEAIKAVVRDISGQEIHYAAMINFAGFENIIDVLGGIDVDLEEPFVEPVQFNEARVCDGDNGGVFTVETGEFEVKKKKNGKITAQYPLCTNENPECGGIFEVPAGKQTLTGEQALCYTRSRATSSDFDRARRQQEVIAQIRQKATSVGLITDLDRINTILGTLGDNIQIDLEPWEVQKFFEFYNNVGESSGTFVLENSAEGLLESPGEDENFGYVLLPRGGTYADIHDLFSTL